MRTLIVGAGALGILTTVRLRAAGAPVWLATRDEAGAERLRATGLRAEGIGGPASAPADPVAPLAAYAGQAPFDLVVLATKGHDALAAAPGLVGLLAPDGILLPIQNGGVPELLAERLGPRVLGGLSNLGAVLSGPGVSTQSNGGHLLVGEVGGGDGDGRAGRVRAWLGQGPGVRVTGNFRGAVWSKLLINCAVTTLGAVAGRTLRQCLPVPGARELFDRIYDETLAVALAAGARPETMLVEPVPPGWAGRSLPGPDHEAWLERVLAAYGEARPSMLHDLELGRRTEIDFINGYVADLGRRLGVPAPANEALVAMVGAMGRGECRPGLDRLEQLRREPGPA
jgi:2-dehydropantoate 2-reductase